MLHTENAFTKKNVRIPFCILFYLCVQSLEDNLCVYNWNRRESFFFGMTRGLQRARENLTHMIQCRSEFNQILFLLKV
jgi:hypothetical protein